jgi:hypothetical protein
VEYGIKSLSLTGRYIFILILLKILQVFIMVKE